MNAFDVVSDVNDELFRLDSMLKAMRVVAFDQVERANQKDTLTVNDFPALFDIALDRLSLLHDHMNEVENTIKLILEGGHLEK